MVTREHEDIAKLEELLAQVSDFEKRLDEAEVEFILSFRGDNSEPTVETAERIDLLKRNLFQLGEQLAVMLIELSSVSQEEEQATFEILFSQLTALVEHYVELVNQCTQHYSVQIQILNHFTSFYLSKSSHQEITATSSSFRTDAGLHILRNTVLAQNKGLNFSTCHFEYVTRERDCLLDDSFSRQEAIELEARNTYLALVKGVPITELQYLGIVTNFCTLLPRPPGLPGALTMTWVNFLHDLPNSTANRRRHQMTFDQVLVWHQRWALFISKIYPNCSIDLRKRTVDFYGENRQLPIRVEINPIDFATFEHRYKLTHPEHQRLGDKITKLTEQLQNLEALIQTAKKELSSNRNTTRDINSVDDEAWKVYVNQHISSQFLTDLMTLCEDFADLLSYSLPGHEESQKVHAIVSTFNHILLQFPEGHQVLVALRMFNQLKELSSILPTAWVNPVTPINLFCNHAMGRSVAYATAEFYNRGDLPIDESNRIVHQFIRWLYSYLRGVTNLNDQKQYINTLATVIYELRREDFGSYLRLLRTPYSDLLDMLQEIIEQFPAEEPQPQIASATVTS